MMDGGSSVVPMSACGLSAAALDRLMPMYLAVAADGTIIGAGVTLAKLFPDQALAGQLLFDVFALRRMRPITSMDDLRSRMAQPLSLIRRDGGGSLRGLAVPIAQGENLLMNLSFGIGVLDAVQLHGLTDADFAPTDLAIELLYVMEAKAAVMGELARLNMGLRGAKSAAEERARTDTLTGLGNRRALDQAFKRILGMGRPFALLHLDLDYFKSVNDTHGHAAGDHVLSVAANVLRSAVRDGDVVTRVGGDEFVLVLPNPPDDSALLRIAGRIIAGLQVPIPFEGVECRISGSIGIAKSTGSQRVDLAMLQSHADAALYASKRAGRGRATLADGSEAAPSTAG
ncbi:MAG: diguanylate cyclase domain-containing protein [Paracoccaceae bacterium]